MYLSQRSKGRQFSARLKHSATWRKHGYIAQGVIDQVLLQISYRSVAGWIPFYYLALLQPKGKYTMEDCVTETPIVDVYLL